MSDPRSTAIDEALHELRRPLQALLLLGERSGGPIESSARLATLALERLEDELQGGGRRQPSEPVGCEAALRSAVARWRARVALGGGSLKLRWRAGEGVLIGDRAGFEQAIDNLIVNAIEHGGPEVVVEARRRRSRLAISVVDSGRAARPRPAGDADRGPGRRPATMIPVTSSSRGHGLRLVRRFAAAEGGRFVLERAERGTVARLELPLPGAALACTPAA